MQVHQSAPWCRSSWNLFQILPQLTVLTSAIECGIVVAVS